MRNATECARFDCSVKDKGLQGQCAILHKRAATVVPPQSDSDAQLAIRGRSGRRFGAAQRSENATQRVKAFL
jgi:hypothetical protein